VNPFGGEKKGLKILADCRQVWETRGIEVTVLETTHAGHAREYAQSVNLAGYQALCVIGGDGSFHELCNGYMNRADRSEQSVALGLIPGGSGNSVMHDLGTLNPIEAATRIADGNTCFYDSIKITDEQNLSIHCVNEATLGLAGDVGVIAEDWRGCFGTGRYDVCGAWFALKGYSEETSITLTMPKEGGGEREETFSDRMVTCFATITQHFGKAMRASPLAQIDDGLFDCFFLVRAKRSETLALFKLLPFGNHMFHPKVTSRQVSKMVISFPKRPRGVMNIDGEVFGFVGGVTLQIEPRQFRMFVPPNTKCLLKE